METQTTYFNSTNLKGEELKKARSKALTQDEAVLGYFKNYSHLGATPERVLKHFQIMEGLNENKWRRTPIVSIRRSFSSLKNKGLIYKTDTMVKGDYGKQIHLWRLVK